MERCLFEFHGLYEIFSTAAKGHIIINYFIPDTGKAAISTCVWDGEQGKQ